MRVLKSANTAQVEVFFLRPRVGGDHRVAKIPLTARDFSLKHSRPGYARGKNKIVRTGT
jgi:hypothetical protein